MVVVLEWGDNEEDVAMNNEDEMENEDGSSAEEVENNDYSGSSNEASSPHFE